MPLYEFVCSKCEKDFESLVRSTKWEGTVACPHCGSKKTDEETFRVRRAGRWLDFRFSARAVRLRASRRLRLCRPHHHH